MYYKCGQNRKDFWKLIFNWLNIFFGSFQLLLPAFQRMASGHQPPPTERAIETWHYYATKHSGAPQVHTTLVNIIPGELSIRDHLPWSIFNTFYINFCCLGFIAVIFSVKSRDRKVIGDRIGAMSYGSTARNLNIAATMFTVITIIVVLIMLLSAPRQMFISI
uniref:Interferon-induced transmembrane protein 1 n=1 Tax=Xenopus tropicalis TaxID=8364 RepID=A0A6I8S9S4_XENTR